VWYISRKGETQDHTNDRGPTPQGSAQKVNKQRNTPKCGQMALVFRRLFSSFRCLCVFRREQTLRGEHTNGEASANTGRVGQVVRPAVGGATRGWGSSEISLH
jgi:hypothetical protein